MVSESLLERVSPSQIAIGDILLLADAWDSEWGEVTAISQQLKNTQCDLNSHSGPVHDYDAYHFTCDVYGQEGDRRGTRTVCEPIAGFAYGRTHLNHKVARRIQKS
jgi:hypothetical protein